MSDEVYKNYVAKCRELGIKPTPMETLKRDGGVKPNFIDAETKKGEVMSETVFGKAGVKKCVKCQFTKSADEFYKSKINKDGLDSYCKECKSLKTSHNQKQDTTEPMAISVSENIACVPKIVDNKPKQISYLSMQRVKELVLEAYARGYETAKEEIQTYDISLDEILCVNSLKHIEIK